jgi:hypothetical protein
VLKLGGGDHRKFDRVGYMIGLVAGYVTCIRGVAIGTGCNIKGSRTT